MKELKIKDIYNLINDPSEDNPIVQAVAEGAFDEIIGYDDIFLCPIRISDALWDEEFDIDINGFWWEVEAEKDPDMRYADWDDFTAGQWREMYGATPAEMLITAARCILGEKHPNVVIENGKIVFRNEWKWLNRALELYFQQSEKENN